MTSTVYLYILLLPFSFTAYIFLLIVKIKMPFLNMTSNGGLNTSIFMIGLKNKSDISSIPMFPQFSDDVWCQCKEFYG